MEVMKKALENYYNEHGVIVNFDNSEDIVEQYGIGEYIKSREENDDDYEWIEDFGEAVEETKKEYGLTLFINDDNVELIYCKPCDKEKAVQWVRDYNDIPIQIDYNKYLCDIGYYIPSKHYSHEYDPNPDFEEQTPVKDFHEFETEWIEEKILI